MYSHPQNGEQGSGGKELTTLSTGISKRAASSSIQYMARSHMTCNPLLNPRTGILISLNLGIIWDLASMVRSRVG